MAEQRLAALKACAQTVRGNVRIGGVIALSAVLVLGRLVFLRGGKPTLFATGLQSGVCEAGRNSMLHAGQWTKVGFQ